MRRSPDPSDRRAVTIGLTDEGRAILTRVERDRLRRNEKFFEHLSPEQQAQLRGLLEQAVAPPDRPRHNPSPH